jgi:PIN domain nuclease of toxin-antitoxin system
MLLDTHVFLWLRSAPKRLSPEVLSAYQDPSNRIYLSIVSVLEMQIKHQIGKLKLDVSLKDLVEEQCDANALEILPLRLDHIFGLQNVPLHHKDPFDRLLIVQSQVEDIRLVSSDRLFNQYDVNLFW